MDQEFPDASRCILSDNDLGQFSSTWQTLLARCQRRFFWLDTAQIEDAIDDAIVRTLTRASQQEAETCRRAVEFSEHSMYGAVCRALGDSIRAEKRRQRRDQEYTSRKKSWYEEDFFVQNGLSAANSSLGNNWEELERLLEESSAKTQTFMALRKQGVKDPTIYAKLLGMAECSVEVQSHAVKRLWNRIRMKLRRLKAKRARESYKH